MSGAVPPLAKGNPLWDYAVWAYGLPGVEKAGLALQDRLGADVNMVLFCCWLAYRGTPAAHLAKYLGVAVKTSREWQSNLVAPLRTARENLKGIIEASALVGNERVAASAVRERVKQCELEMEQLQILSLYAIVTDAGGESARSPLEQKDDALNNLKLYFAAAGVTLDPLGQTHVMRILTAIFGA